MLFPRLPQTSRKVGTQLGPAINVSRWYSTRGSNRQTQRTWMWCLVRWWAGSREVANWSEWPVNTRLINVTSETLTEQQPNRVRNDKEMKMMMDERKREREREAERDAWGNKRIRSKLWSSSRRPKQGGSARQDAVRWLVRNWIIFLRARERYLTVIRIARTYAMRPAGLILWIPP